MASKNKNKRPKKEIAFERENQIEQGYFDGRFAPKIVQNKKKKKGKENKYKKRTIDYINYDED